MKEQRKGAFGNIIELAQMPFGLVPKNLDAIDMTALVINQFMVVDSFTLVSLYGQCVIPTQESENTTLAGETFLRMIGTNSARPQLAIIWA